MDIQKRKKISISTGQFIVFEISDKIIPNPLKLFTLL